MKKNQIYFIVLIGIGLTLNFGCNKDDNGMSPLSTKVYTTVDQMIEPIPVPQSSPMLLPYEISKFSEYGYGVWQFGPGLDYEKRLDLMPATYDNSSVVNTAKLLNFFTLSDVHIMDEETPSQGAYFGLSGKNASAYSPNMLFTTQVLDAAIRTINKLNKENSFDFGIALGDNTNSNQLNEHQWFIDVLDGKNINPDSGIDDDPIVGPNNDYQDEFKAEGLDQSIPWYQVLGNHDHFWLGSLPVDDYIKQSLTSEYIIDMGDFFTDPNGANSRGIYGGAINGNTINGDVYGYGPVENFTSPPKVPAPDPNRRAVSLNECKDLFLNSTTKPLGHGLNEPSTIFGCYSFEPNADLPIKVIVLDDTQTDNDFDIHEHGYIDNERFNWLISEMDKGQSDGKLMIIASHIPIPAIDHHAHSPISKSTLVGKLYEYPNLLIWMSGHVHRNKVIAFPSPVSEKPELGFWHVETSSLRDFPQQFRTFQITRNNDNTISIFATNVNPDVEKGSLAEKSRSYAIATMQTMGLPMEGSSYNAELQIQLTPEMQAKIQNYGTSINN